MSEQERKTMLILSDTLVGEINRMCVTKDLSEFDTMYAHAKKNLDKLSKMIYESRFKEDTGVVYLQFEGYRRAGITVALNADGTPITVEQIETEEVSE